jgi:hypothetical protein
MTAVERAFELAGEGKSIREIRATLAREGLDSNHIHGREILRQLQQHRLALRGPLKRP